MLGSLQPMTIVSFALVILSVSLGVIAMLTLRRLRIAREAGAVWHDEQGRAKKTLADTIERLEHDLEGSGIKLSGREIGSLWAAAIAIPPLVAGILGTPFAMCLLLAVLGTIAPFIAVRALKGRNERRFEEMLGQALPLMASNLRGGMSIRQSILPVAQDMDEPIRSEFAILARDIGTGMPVADAVDKMAERNNNRDLKLLSSAVRAQQKTGGNLAAIVEQVGATVRERVSLRMEVRGKTSQGRATMWIMAVVPPVLLAALWTMNDMYAEFFGGPMGPLVLIACAVMEILGIVVTNKICKIETD